MLGSRILVDRFFVAFWGWLNLSLLMGALTCSEDPDSSSDK
jgi:hypothetical protein